MFSVDRYQKLFPYATKKNLDVFLIFLKNFLWTKKCQKKYRKHEIRSHRSAILEKKYLKLLHHESSRRNKRIPPSFLFKQEKLPANINNGREYFDRSAAFRKWFIFNFPRHNLYMKHTANAVHIFFCADFVGIE